MKIVLAPVLLIAALCAALAEMPEPNAAPQDPQQATAEMAAMMEKARAFTQPGENHKLLERFLGTWNTETRFNMGGQLTPPEKGTAETSWLMEGRWLKTEATGLLMGQPTQVFSIIGYDNFKMSYVITTVSSMDTAMIRSEGDLDPNTNALLLYGTLDEYLTGEHDKMVKTVFRFPSEDKMIMEIHDLPIGETNTMVVEITYTRS